MSQSTIDVEKLTPEDRLRLLERLWDSLDDSDVPITATQKQELNRRLDELESEGPLGIPWDEVLSRLEREPL